MITLWFALGVIFGAGGLVFGSAAEVVAGVFCGLMSAFSAVVHEVTLYRRQREVAHRPLKGSH